jgi:hypothetical protein
MVTFHPSMDNYIFYNQLHENQLPTLPTYASIYPPTYLSTHLLTYLWKMILKKLVTNYYYFFQF